MKIGVWVCERYGRGRAWIATAGTVIGLGGCERLYAYGQVRAHACAATAGTRLVLCSRGLVCGRCDGGGCRWCDGAAVMAARVGMVPVYMWWPRRSEPSGEVQNPRWRMR